MNAVTGFRGVALALASLCASSGATHAEEWPARQAVKIIVPFTAGSATDIVARTVFEQVGRQVGQTFVPENRGGAGTTLGMAAVAKADPDGYTLLVHSTSHVVVASTYAKLPFDAVNDFAPITALANIPYIITTPVKYRSLADLIAAGKAPGSALTYGSAGVGSSGQLFQERFRTAAGFPATHVPFRGTPEGMVEIVAGRLDMYSAPAINAIELTRDNKISSLAASSSKRVPLMPEVPTLAELGLAAATYNFWVGAFAPARTPSAVLDRLNGEIVTALKQNAIADKIVALGGDPNPMTRPEFEAFVRSELAVNAEILKASGFKPLQ